MAKLITVNSYAHLFPALIECLDKKVNSIEGNNIIFMEEKSSLMAERTLFDKYRGSFNTAVYSFGNYLRANLELPKVLSKEGSAMAIKRILTKLPLSCFKASKEGLAPSMFDLIMLLKSAKVTTEHLESALDSTSGILKNKLIDILSIYEEYDNFTKDNGYDDQSSMLNYLPALIESDEKIKKADIYLVGYNGWTSQMISAITSLLNNAKSVTAILVEGKNSMLYVNETCRVFERLCKENGKSVERQTKSYPTSIESSAIVERLFNPLSDSMPKIESQKVFSFTSDSISEECERVALSIKQKVMSGECRYRDITVAIPDVEEYGDDIERAFNLLQIPFFLDDKKKVHAHPLVRLIISYVDAHIKNLQFDPLSEFYKNPLFCDDLDFADTFENYTLALGINYSRIKKPFTFDEDGKYDLDKLNEFRQRVVDCFDTFNVKKLLETLDVENKLKQFSTQLTQSESAIESAINDQIYTAIIGLLDQMQLLLGSINISLLEYKNIFTSGISAMQLSIIPQYNDAVFVGAYRQTALASAKHLFAVGLTNAVPNVQDDVLILNDNDIDTLKNVKVLIEPKIKVINHRSRESVGMALSAFSESLTLSYPTTSKAGATNVKSEILRQMEKLFTLSQLKETDQYLTEKYGLHAFARQCGNFVDGKIQDFSSATTYLDVVGEERLKPLLDNANKEVKIRLETNGEIMAKSHVSPTKLEAYYSCPYQAFLRNGLGLTTRDEGVVNVLSIGNFIHEILNVFAHKVESVKDREDCDKLVREIAQEVASGTNYAKFFEDATNAQKLENAIRESQKYCYRTYLSLVNSNFKVSKTEARIGDYTGKNGYRPLMIDGGKVALTGFIDRVDECEDYFRILDYKTGSSDANLEQLFKGKKLQLYLYSQAIREDSNGKKKLAGAYYLPISDNYIVEGDSLPPLSKGVTLDDEKVITMHDNAVLASGESDFFQIDKKKESWTIQNALSERAIESCQAYAVKMAEQAVRQMREGVLVASPSDSKVCEYCEFKAMCQQANPTFRTVQKVDSVVIIDADEKGV